MNQYRKWIALAALLALPAAAVVIAQTTAQNGQSTRGVQQGALQGGLNYADSSLVVPGVDPTLKGWYTVEQDPARDDVVLFQDVINATLANAAVDSSGILDVHRYRYLKLLVKAHLTSGASTGHVRLIFQLREHMNSLADSNSTFAEYTYAATNQAVALSLVDSTLTGHLATGSASLPWSGEFIVNVTGNRAAPGNAVAAVPYSYPNGIGIPLDTVYGRPARFNKMSIRVRNATATGGNACIVKVSVLGFAS